MSDFITVHGKVIPVKGGASSANTNAGHRTGPKVNTGPRQGKYWNHPSTGKKHYGAVPAKHQAAVQKQQSGKGTGTVAQGPSKEVMAALKRAGSGKETNHGSSSPHGKPPRSGHPSHPKMGEHKPKTGKGHEGDNAAAALAKGTAKKGPSALGAIANVAKEIVEQPKSKG